MTHPTSINSYFILHTQTVRTERSLSSVSAGHVKMLFVRPFQMLRVWMTTVVAAMFVGYLKMMMLLSV